MNAVDKMIRKERYRRYRTIRQLFRARDSVRPYVKNGINLKISFLLNNLEEENLRYMTVKRIANIILMAIEIHENKPPTPPKGYKTLGISKIIEK